ncbi:MULTISPECIES: HipA family kinase [unclassified Paenibacillus]|uniref:HipA family kinase n=1 Tax=unclassified Paenibacillus TaxID=185978 RepID=UPI001AE946A2|nr:MULTISPECIES: HipA family kinase [unclassified Paenibacillus]MBP1168742.1 hypothetical protein [Paenibacillus sp. PvR098]
MKDFLIPLEYIKPMETGYSKPQLIRFDDGQEYVVKFRNNPSGTRILVNEYIASRLAELLCLPVPAFKIMPIPRSFIDQNPAIPSRFEGGNQFATLFIPHCTSLNRDLHTPKQLQIVNRSALAGMIVFDKWIGNTDRKDNNLLLQPVGEGAYQVIMIDHGRCFSDAKWKVKTLRKMPDMEKILKVHQWCASYLESPQELVLAADQIVSLPEDSIYQVVDSIPEDWEVSGEEREAVARHLIQAKTLLHGIRISTMRKSKL